MLQVIVFIILVLFLPACGQGGDSSKPAVDPYTLFAESLELAPKNSTDLYFGDGRTVTYIWQMEGDDVSTVNGRFPGAFVVDVKVKYELVNGVNTATGYIFSKPRLQMFTGEFEVEVEGIILRINGEKPEGTEPFLSARKTARGSDPTVFYDGSITITREAISSSDKISFGFGYLDVKPRTDNPPTPPNPTLAIANSYVANVNVGVQASNDGTARRWCVTADPRRPTSTGTFCPGFENSATSSGWLTARPTTFSLTNIGRVVNPGETITLYLWVANSDLKISAAAGSAVVTYDPTAPSKPTFNVSLGATQVADLAINDVNEPADWCVQDGTTQMSVEDERNCTFTAAKPTFVGLRGGGQRYVAVFARDRARNITRSDVKTLNNVYGRISFLQLSDPATAARAVFANRCASCHGAGAAEQARWDESSYTSTVALKTNILNRISNATSPMPPTGLIDIKEQALIRLWFTQTATPVEQ